MRKINYINKEFLVTLDPEFKKALTAKKVQNAFARAVERVFRGDAAARVVLEHVQAVYVMRDTRPYKKGATPDVYLYIYSSDSTVRSELDFRQDWIRLALADEDIHYDRVKIYASKMGMKKRRPYEEYLSQKDADARERARLDSDVVRHNLSESEMCDIASCVEDAGVRNALLRAMQATRG